MSACGQGWRARCRCQSQGAGALDRGARSDESAASGQKQLRDDEHADTPAGDEDPRPSRIAHDGITQPAQSDFHRTREEKRNDHAVAHAEGNRRLVATTRSLQDTRRRSRRIDAIGRSSSQFTLRSRVGAALPSGRPSRGIASADGHRQARASRHRRSDPASFTPPSRHGTCSSSNEPCVRSGGGSSARSRSSP
jgi:hypothetical protein